MLSNLFNKSPQIQAQADHDRFVQQMGNLSMAIVESNIKYMELHDIINAMQEINKTGRQLGLTQISLCDNMYLKLVGDTYILFKDGK